MLFPAGSIRKKTIMFIYTSHMLMFYKTKYVKTIPQFIPMLIEKLLATVVEGNPKTPFSIATTLRCRGRCHSFPSIAPFYPWYVPYIAEC